MSSMIAFAFKAGCVACNRPRLRRAGVASILLFWCGALCVLSGCSHGRTTGSLDARVVVPGMLASVNAAGTAQALSDIADRNAVSPTLIPQSKPASSSPHAARANASDSSPSKVKGNPILVALGDRAGNNGEHGLALASLDDGQLEQVRGGLDTGSGAELNFAFQQSTVVNNNVVENVILPTITVAGNGTAASIGGAAVSNTNRLSASTFGAPSFVGLRGTGAPSDPIASAIVPGTIVSNGQILQVNPMASGALGDTMVMSTFGTAGLTNLVTNTANNQHVQQMTTINIGVTGLQQLLQQGIPTSVINQLNMTNALHH